MFTQTIKIVVLALLLLALMFIVRVLTTLAVYFDIKALGIKNKFPWLIFVFFFPFIAGILYFSVRKKHAKKIVPKMCCHCGVTVDNSVNVCPNCIGVDFVDYVMPHKDRDLKISKVFVICAIVFFILYGATYSNLYTQSKQFITYNPYRSSDNFDDFSEFDDFFSQDPFASLY